MSVDLHLPDTFVPTHETSGLPGFHARDFFAPAGSFVTAPADCRLVWPHFIPWDGRKRVGGWTCYLVVDQGKLSEHWFFLTHFGLLRERGHYHKGGVIGTVGAVATVPPNLWGPHIHDGRHQGRFTPAKT